PRGMRDFVPTYWTMGGSQRGARKRAAITMKTAVSPAKTANRTLPLAASAAVPAQAIDENASAKVASRDEVCRRRKRLRFACTLNQSWMKVAAVAAARMPSAATSAWNAENAS